MRFSVFEEEISEIRDSITHGEFKKALEQIEDLEKKELSNIEKDILNLQKSRASIRYGHHDLALELVEMVLPKFLEYDLPKYYLEALSQKAYVLIEKSKLDEALYTLKKKVDILDSLTSEELEEMYQERCSLLTMEGNANYHKGDNKRAAKLAKECLELADHYNYKFGFGIALLNLAYSHARLGQREKALDFREESLRVFTELDNQYWIAYVQHHFGFYYLRLGDYDKAIECFLKIKPFVDKTENAYQKIIILYHLSYAYEINLEPDIAYDYTLQAYQLLDKSDRLDMKDIILGKLVNMSLNIGEYEKADEYFEELKPIIRQRDKSNYNYYMRRYEIRKLMKKLYENNNALLRGEVERKVREMIKDETIEKDSRRGLLWELCSILFHEYISTGDNSLIDEIDSITTELLEETNIYFSEIGRISALSYRLIALWLQAKIGRDEKKTEEIQQLLSKTEEYAGVKGNKLLVKSIQNLQEHYSSLMEELEDFIKKYSTTN